MQQATPEPREQSPGPMYAVTGRYIKLSRQLRHACLHHKKDERKLSSVEMEIAIPIKRALGAARHKFSSAGREDLDVRMLGTGRPFVLKLSDCKNTPQQALHHLKAENILKKKPNHIFQIDQTQNQPLVIVNRLQIHPWGRGWNREMHIHTALRRKSYSCLVRIDITPPNLVQVGFSNDQPIILAQRTPLRTLSSRPDRTRPRTIYHVTITKLETNLITINIEAQSGTYIKEYVTSDFGRTHPSFGDLISVAPRFLSVVALDVLCIHDPISAASEDNPLL